MNAARHEPVGALYVDHVDIVLLHVLLERGRELRPLGFLDRHEILDRHRIEHLAAEALGDDARRDALARRVDRRRRARGAAADDQHVEHGFLRERLRRAPARAAVEFREDLLHAAAALAERLAVQEDRRHGHDPARLDFVLEQRAVDHHVADARVDERHHVERLHDFRAVLAGERDIRLECVVAVERANLLDRRVVELDRMAARLQQREHERREFVAHRHTGEANARGLARLADRERRRALGRVAAFGHEDLRRQRRDLVEQRAQLARLVACVERCDELDGARDPFEVRFQLSLEMGVEHDDSDSIAKGGLARRTRARRRWSG
ncbi:hypothetical protein DM45_2743 [Burkholderia mallei]|nr:hypothetical protein DM45_2743 [Burkholderia mallei]